MRALRRYLLFISRISAGPKWLLQFCNQTSRGVGKHYVAFMLGQVFTIDGRLPKNATSHIFDLYRQDAKATIFCLETEIKERLRGNPTIVDNFPLRGSAEFANKYLPKQL